jgi:hypothetical protein
MKTKSIKRPYLLSLCCAALLGTGSTAIAVTSDIANKTVFDILSKVYVDETLVSSPRVIAHANQKASIFISEKMSTTGKRISMSGNSLKLELVAKDVAISGKDGGIKINYDIQIKNGKNKMHSKPEIILSSNQEGTVNFSDAAHDYEIHVLAKRK